jgi:tetratricopeptide (TPR) repeat protein
MLPKQTIVKETPTDECEIIPYEEVKNSNETFFEAKELGISKLSIQSTETIKLVENMSNDNTTKKSLLSKIKKQEENSFQEKQSKTTEVSKSIEQEKKKIFPLKSAEYNYIDNPLPTSKNKDLFKEMQPYEKNLDKQVIKQKDQKTLLNQQKFEFTKDTKQTSQFSDKKKDSGVETTPVKKPIFSKNNLLKKVKAYKEKQRSKEAEAQKIKDIEKLQEVGIQAFQKGNNEKVLSYANEAKKMCKNSNLDTTKFERTMSYFQTHTLLKSASTKDIPRIIQIIQEQDSVSSLLPRLLNRKNIEAAKKNGFKDLDLTNIQKAILIYKNACAKLKSSSEYESIIRGAISDFKKASDLNPDLKGPSFEKIGDCFVILKLLDNALNMYKHSLNIVVQVDDTDKYHITNINPNQINAKIAKCLGMLNKTDEAIKQYDELIETDPKTISHYFNKAKLLMSTDIKSAIKTCIKAIKLNPKSYEAFNLLSNMYNNNENYNSALKSAESSLNIKETEDGYAEYARALSGLGNTKVAKEKLNAAIKMNSENSAHYILKAEISLKKAKEILNNKKVDDYSEALENFIRANEMNETLYSSLEIIKLLKYSQNKEEINKNLLKYLDKISELLSKEKPSKENKELKNCIFSTKQLYEIKSSIDSHINELNELGLKEILNKDKEDIDNLNKKIFTILSTIDSIKLSIDKNALKEINKYLINFTQIKNTLGIDSQDPEDQAYSKSNIKAKVSKKKSSKIEVKEGQLQNEKTSSSDCILKEQEDEKSKGTSYKINICSFKSTTQCSTSIKESIKDCTIFVQTDSVYDNKLLNNPSLFNYCTQILGIKSVMELSRNLSNELIEESLESHDYDIAVAGLMSLQQE